MGDNLDQPGQPTPPHAIRRAFRIIVSVPVWLYQKVVSPAIPPHCIYSPTCSEYTRQAILRHGVIGILAGIMRLFRCIGGIYTGGDDPVPDTITARYLFGSYRRFRRRRSEHR